MLNELKSLIRHTFPSLNQSRLIDEIWSHHQFHQFSINTIIFDIGSQINFVPLVLTGAIKVFREDEAGNELFLYYILPGQSCAMTLSACAGSSSSTVRAVTTENTSLITLPDHLVSTFVFRYPSWNNFIIDTYTHRLNEILVLVDNIAFHNMDMRLLRYLVEKSQVEKTRILNISNSEIARDLNSSREVISRLLKQMEKKQMVKTSRGRIELLN
ncbi:MAG: Crp/Fnr family transcriptional regulator [Bacteroidota bacterium]